MLANDLHCNVLLKWFDHGIYLNVISLIVFVLVILFSIF